MNRIEPPTQADERATLTGFLDYQRATLAWKCEGLTPEQLATRSVSSTSLSLLGLVRHMAEVERGWFRDFAGERGPDGGTLPQLYSSAADRDADFDGAIADPNVVEQAFFHWQSEIEHARVIVAAAPLEQTFVDPGDG
jgi:uncharacterized damage-inducible protein DinB